MRYALGTERIGGQPNYLIIDTKEDRVVYRGASKKFVANLIEQMNIKSSGQ